MLWIHAGPHKAASSYITERLRQNRQNLAAQGVLMDGDNNHLANAIAEKRYEAIDQALANLPDTYRRVLLSSSSLDDRILSKVALGHLEAMADRHGFQLGVSYCIRDQPSWLNSVYGHRVRRFRETPDFPDYCDYIMNDRDSWDIAYPSKFKVFKLFPEITTLFLPLSKQVAVTDPFLALVAALDLETPQGAHGSRRGAHRPVVAPPAVAWRCASSNWGEEMPRSKSTAAGCTPNGCSVRSSDSFARWRR